MNERVDLDMEGSGRDYIANTVIKPMVEKWSGVSPLELTAFYGIREYTVDAVTEAVAALHPPAAEFLGQRRVEEHDGFAELHAVLGAAERQHVNAGTPRHVGRRHAEGHAELAVKRLLFLDHPEITRCRYGPAESRP